jgi:cation diffusion facilitator CzcD-associated flavoprotein CzcO
LVLLDSFAPAEEIGDYFISVAKKHGLHELITFSSTIVGAKWAEDRDLWKVRVEHKSSGVNGDGPLVTEYEADLLINAGGILNNWSWPSIPGLHDFGGQLVHTAAWVCAIPPLFRNLVADS